MSDYAAQINTASRLLASKGQSVTVHRLEDDSAYDPVNPRTAARTVVASAPGNAAVLPASNGTIEAFDSRILSDPVQRRDFRFLILAAKGLTIVPQAGDLIETAAGTWRVLGATALNVNGSQPILYNVGCTLDVPPFSFGLAFVSFASEDGLYYFVSENDEPFTPES